MNVKLSYKKCSVVCLVLLMIISAGMIYFTKDIRAQFGQLFINGPKFYPILLSSIMLLSCLASIFHTLKKEDKIIEFPNFHKPVIVSGILLAWVIAWQTCARVIVTNTYFYPISALGVGALLLYLNPEPWSVKKLAKSALIDAAVIVPLYLLFAVGLRMRL